MAQGDALDAGRAVQVYKSSKGTLAGSMVAINYSDLVEQGVRGDYPPRVLVSMFAAMVINHLDKVLECLDRPFCMFTGADDEVLQVRVGPPRARGRRGGSAAGAVSSRRRGSLRRASARASN